MTLLSACANFVKSNEPQPVVIQRVHYVDLFNQIDSVEKEDSAWTLDNIENEQPIMPNSVITQIHSIPVFEPIPKTMGQSPEDAHVETQMKQGQDIEPVIINDSTVKYTYELFKQEYLDEALKRWAEREHYVIDYRASFRIPVLVDATVPSTSLSDAITYILKKLWDTRTRLIAEELPNQTIVVRTP